MGGRVSYTSRVKVTPEQQATSVLNGKRFISDLEVEARYGIPRRTLQNWRVLGRGPVYRKFGKGVRYDVNMLEEWIEALPSGGEGIPSSSLKGRSQAS
jgi:hypothetical protein